MDNLDTCADCGKEMSPWDNVVGYDICEECYNRGFDSEIGGL